jgi:hypothetical protein
MSSNTTKVFDDHDEQQIIRKVYNPEEGTLAVGGFVAGKLGHKVIRAISSPTVDTYSFYDNSTLLYVLTVTYDDSSHTNVNQVERTT